MTKELYQSYEGEERRKTPMHMEPLAQCVERYKTIVEKLDNVVERLDKINGRYDTHLVEAISYRATIEAHTKRFDEMHDQNKWMIGLIFSVVLTIVIHIITFSFLWGQLTKEVSMNNKELEEIEFIHPRLLENRIAK